MWCEVMWCDVMWCDVMHVYRCMENNVQYLSSSTINGAIFPYIVPDFIDFVSAVCEAYEQSTCLSSSMTWWEALFTSWCSFPEDYGPACPEVRLECTHKTSCSSIYLNWKWFRRCVCVAVFRLCCTCMQSLSIHVAVETDRNVRRFNSRGLCQLQHCNWRRPSRSKYLTFLSVSTATWMLNNCPVLPMS